MSSCTWACFSSLPETKPNLSPPKTPGEELETYGCNEEVDAKEGKKEEGGEREKDTRGERKKSVVVSWCCFDSLLL